MTSHGEISRLPLMHQWETGKCVRWILRSRRVEFNNRADIVAIYYNFQFDVLAQLRKAEELDSLVA